MAARKVVFRLSAENDLDSIDEHIAIDSPQRAAAFTQRIRHACMRLADFPNAGRLRNDLRPGLRTIPIEGRVMAAYEAAADAVTIIRLFYGGRDFERLIRQARHRDEV